jgi:hypothetical protein
VEEPQSSSQKSSSKDNNNEAADEPMSQAFQVVSERDAQQADVPDVEMKNE